jgi:hypothetical protein
VLHHHPVLALERDDVGDGGEGHVIQEVVRQVDRQAERRDESLDQLEGDAGTAEVRGPRAIARALRVTPMPAARARSTASTAVIPQSQVMMRDAPASLAASRPASPKS